MSNFPEGWQDCTVEDLVRFSGGSQPPKSTFVHAAKDGYIRLIQIRDYKTDKFATYIPEYLANKLCDENDIMIACYGPPIFQILRGLRGAYNVALIKAIPDETRLFREYLYYFLQREDLFRLIDGLSQRSSGQTGIDMKALNSFALPLPPLPEQRKIVAILSTWDEAIALTQQLIAALQQRKQALMQLLLTGEVRFKEFDGEWEEIRIGDEAFLTAGGTPSTYVPEYWGGEIRWMSSGEVHQKRVYEVDGRITELGLSESSAKLIPVNSVLVALAGQGKTRGTVAINKVELSTNQSIAAIIPDPRKLHYEFLFYNLDNRYDELRRLSTGDGGRGGLNLQILKGIYLLIPSIPEQQKISEALQVCDEELEFWGQYISQLQIQKRGLMQQLLTGAVRVSVEE